MRRKTVAFDCILGITDEVVSDKDKVGDYVH